jgi:cytochrome P450
MGAMTEPASFPMPRSSPFHPPPEYHRLRAEQPISKARLDFDGSEVWIVARYEDVRAVLSDLRFSSDFSKPGFPARLTVQPPGAGTFIRMDPPDHTRLRKALSLEFTVNKVKSLHPAIEQIVDGLIDGMTAKTPPIDLVDEFALPVPSLVICELLGVPYEDRSFFHDVTQQIGVRETSTEERQKVRTALRSYLGGLVASRRAKPTEDILGRLVARQQQTGLTDDEVVGVATLLLIAGYETIANMIALGTAALLDDPAQLTALRADPSKIPAAVDELLRHQTIMQYGIRRAATEDVEVGGQLIRAGEGVVVLVASANRDPSEFPAPDELDVDRRARQHLSFGYGPHQCIGQLLARSELAVAWTKLLQRIPTLRLAVPVEEIPFKHDMFVYGVHKLPVTW